MVCDHHSCMLRAHSMRALKISLLDRQDTRERWARRSTKLKHRERVCARSWRRARCRRQSPRLHWHCMLQRRCATHIMASVLTLSCLRCSHRAVKKKEILVAELAKLETDLQYRTELLERLQLRHEQLLTSNGHLQWVEILVSGNTRLFKPCWSHAGNRSGFGEKSYQRFSLRYMTRSCLYQNKQRPRVIAIHHQTKSWQLINNVKTWKSLILARKRLLWYPVFFKVWTCVESTLNKSVWHWRRQHHVTYRL